MLFDEYQKIATDTALYPNILIGISIYHEAQAKWVYPVLGLGGELGELAQELWEDIIVSDNIIKEVGDVIWYISAICSEMNILMSDVTGCSNFTTFQDRVLYSERQPILKDLLLEAFIEIGIINENAKKSIRDSKGIISLERVQTIKTSLGRILAILAIICKRQGLNFDAVAQTNLDKLATRKANGTISGSGNDR